MTFGGGPDGALNAIGSLHGGINRTRDLNLRYTLRFDVSLNGQCEDDVIEKLISNTNSYNKGRKVPYALFPEPGVNPFVKGGTYNSNSFAAGLAKSAGITLPTPRDIQGMVRAPGYDKPLPLK